MIIVFNQFDREKYKTNYNQSNYCKFYTIYCIIRERNSILYPKTYYYSCESLCNIKDHNYWQNVWDFY